MPDRAGRTNGGVWAGQLSWLPRQPLSTPITPVLLALRGSCRDPVSSAPTRCAPPILPNILLALLLTVRVAPVCASPVPNHRSLHEVDPCHPSQGPGAPTWRMCWPFAHRDLWLRTWPVRKHQANNRRLSGPSSQVTVLKSQAPLPEERQFWMATPFGRALLSSQCWILSWNFQPLEKHCTKMLVALIMRKGCRLSWTSPENEREPGHLSAPRTET